jgi:hypothetical protein
MRVLKALTGIILMFLIFCPDVYAARISKELEENTRITPPGVIVAVRANIPVFKKGTVVLLNDFGEVVRGTISTKQTINLNPANYITVSNAEISFYPNGMVSTCTLARDSYLRPVGWSQILTDNFTDRIACSGFVEFKGGKPQ